MHIGKLYGQCRINGSKYNRRIEDNLSSKKRKLLNFESLSTEMQLSNLILETMKAIIVFESHNL